MTELANNIKKNPDQRWIVISDTHIGGNPEGSNIPNDNDLCCFLDWIKHLDEKGETIWVKKDELDHETTISSPSRIILLGDIFDLWDPEKSDRNYNIKRGAEPLSLLNDIKCDKVYVVGNHDQDLYELADVLEKDKDSLIFGKYKLEVYRRHYPLNVDKGIMIGDLKYAFLHGQQFDKVQITETVNNILGIRFDPLDVVQDISNISIVKPVFKETNKQTLVYFFVTGLLLVWGYVQSWLFWLVTLVRMPQFLISILSSLLKLSWALLLSYVVLTPLVKLIAKYQGHLWNFLFKAKARDKTVKEVLDDGYYKESSDKMENVNVVVFGYTHIAGSSYLESKRKLFVNTGGWVKETDGRKLNTFAYIDNNGIEVLSWTGRKEDERYVFEHICSHPASSLKK
ncbi:MAG: hypothetical protein J5U16_05985 [Candidatus Methanoperedens sp.]|nr:hypothetical protein [Candidatus Methanoperedens sp.]